MTSSQRDEALRQKIKFEILAPLVSGQQSKMQREGGSLVKQSSHEAYDHTVDELMQLILLDRSQHELKAKINTYKHLNMAYWDDETDSIPCNDIDKEIAALTAQLEAIKQEKKYEQNKDMARRESILATNRRNNKDC